MLNKIRTISIIDIAAQLNIKVRGNKCCCPFHDDKHPSMVLWSSINGWKCFACGEKGTSIDLVMKKLDLTFQEAVHWIARQNNIWIDDAPKEYHRTAPTQVRRQHEPKPQTQQPPQLLPSELLQQCRSNKNHFFASLISSGILTQQQAEQAAEAYHLGSTRDGGVIFWQIDEHQKLHEGKVMWYESKCHRSKERKPLTVSYYLKSQGKLPKDWHFTPCFFGQHLVNGNETLRYENENALHAQPSPSPFKGEGLLPLPHREGWGGSFHRGGWGGSIAIVESEKTAVICSQLIPHTSNSSPIIWLASGGLSNLSPEMFLPLKGYDIILFPDTDPNGNTHKQWSAIAEEASKLINHPIYVSPFLEQHATPEQKARKIDLADLNDSN